MVKLFKKVKLVVKAAFHKVKHACHELVLGSGRVVLWILLGVSFLSGYMIGSL